MMLYSKIYIDNIAKQLQGEDNMSVFINMYEVMYMYICAYTLVNNHMYCLFCCKDMPYMNPMIIL